jgi:hypothetical protein
MRVLSKQRGVAFVFCADPVTIDKRKSWGENADNLQHAPNGAFLKMKSPTEVSHLVQPNDDKTAPVGWMPAGDGLFDKLPIHILRRVEAGETVKLQTLDGEITYEVKEPSAVVCNDKAGQPNEADSWVQDWSDIVKNYEV